MKAEASGSARHVARKAGKLAKDAGGIQMRCGCPQCGTYMIQSEGPDVCCVCPECLYRCRACMGTDTVVSREALSKLVFVDHTVESPKPEDESDCSGPLRPEDMID